MKKYSSGDRRKMFYWQADRPFTGEEIKQVFLDRFERFDPEVTRKAIEYGMQESGKSKDNSKVIHLGDPIDFGSINTSVFAELEDGTKVIIRMHPREAENTYFYSESLVAKAALDAGVKTYKTYFVHEADDKFNFDFILMQQVPGVAQKSLWPIDDKDDEKYVRDTGREIAKLHKIETKGYGFFNNDKAKRGELVGYHSEWKDHIYAAFEENLKYLVDTGLYSKKIGDNLEEIISKNEDLMKLEKPTIIHNDLADWNIMVDPKEKKVNGLIDWDESFSGDYVMEFAQWSLFFDNDRMKFLKEGYEEISSFDDDFEDKMHLYRVRYIVAKSALRKKIVMYKSNANVEKKLKFAMKNLKQELKYYGY